MVTKNNISKSETEPKNNKTKNSQFVKVKMKKIDPKKSLTIKNNFTEKEKIVEAEILENDDNNERFEQSNTNGSYDQYFNQVIITESEDIDYETSTKKTNHKDLVISSPLQRYLSQLRKYPLMTKEEEHLVAIEAHEKNDIEARNRLVTANLRLVVKIAMEYRRAYSQILDLIQEGNAGLMQAVNRFNPYRNVKLSTYSAWWIRAYILKFLMDNKSLVRMGTTDAQRKLFFKLRSEAEKMYALTQKFDAQLLADKIGVEKEDVLEMQQRLMKNDVSLDTPIDDENQTRHIDLLTTENGEEDSYERKEKNSIVREQIDEIEKNLSERDLYIFQNRIIADEPITLQELGQKYGITRERARQLEAKILSKIKARFQKKNILSKI